ncbi:SWI/SNF-related matrix-associated actin-dependent regulator of chromatin subfamily A containing DEAD/H box 1A isoform X2 [Aplysia californica]|uniref:DNA helicase n=1 Tax=Aplysia californica TaxID=6500 RepID=A0ABM0JYR7_APLCA|nr:SWI/SNF-related matrix-associated actin-dependent regulator of chromatin subfamily A containing DEAD/H box 1A isoform X2 [Aplysia californica]
MSAPDGSLSTLLKYRFTKKIVPKLNHTDSQQKNGPNGLGRENSSDSLDSQATVLYSQGSFPSASNSQDSEGSQQTSSPVVTTNSDSGSLRSPGSQPAAAATSSPLIPSNVNQSIASDVSPAQQSSPSAVPGSGPWMSKTTGPVQTNGDSKFKRVKRPEPDSDDSDESPGGKPEPLKINEKWLKKLRIMFPLGSENRMRAALIVYPKNFDKAVEFMTSESTKKRPAPEDAGEDDPGITKSYKRIKPMSESPSPPKVVSVDFLKESSQDQKSVEFLQGCFPAKSVKHLQSVLAASNGDTELAVEKLSAESQPGVAGPSTTGTGKPQKSLSMLTEKMTSQKHASTLQTTVKVKAKRRDVDFSDDEDDYEDEFDGSGDSDDSEDLDNRSKTETDSFLQFFEEATKEELTAMPGCSKKKSEVIISLRPFTSWENLYEKFSSEKQLSTSLISGCKEIMQVRNAIRRLMIRCESISQQMGLVVSRLTEGQSTKGAGDKYRIAKQPDLLNKDFELQPYQLIGVSWLRIMHEQQLNGILADEMGLGKTIQAIAFIAHLKEHGEEGPHVIIVPSSTIENWLRELQLWCPSLKVVVYYGSQEERRAVRHSIFFQGEEFNVLLTTYNMATGGVEDRVLFKKFEFHYAVFDEGHMLKNMSSLRFQNLMKIAADRRLLLTGTPLQNNLLELMSLLCFVMPEIFQGKTEHLKKVFAMITRSEDKQKSRFERDRIAQAKRIMKPFILRRLKQNVLNQLPKKTENIERCSMIPIQQELYDSLVARYSQELSDENAEPSTGGVGIFMQFRKAANHPLLLRNLYTDDKLKQMSKRIAKEPSHRDRGALPELIQEDMSLMNDFELLGLCKQYEKNIGKFILDPSVITDSGKLRVLDRLLPNMKEKGDRVLLFSQFTMMLDILEVYMEQRGYKYLRLDGQTPVPDRLQLIDKFNVDPEIFVFLLSTRAGGLGINLTAANTIILHDIDFNPYNDKQAEDRCHRLGQKREVSIYKLICEDTVDEAMLRCANDKLALEKDLTESNSENEEDAKDVANLLKEVLKAGQVRKAKEAGQSGSVETAKSTSS